MVKYLHYILAAALLALTSCNSSESQEEPIIKKPAFKGMTEGSITYRLDYEANDDNSIVVSFMPKELILNFKDNQISILSSMALGQITGNILLDTKNKIATTGINYGAKHLKTTLTGNDVKFDMFNFDDCSVQKTAKISTIQGMNCSVTNMIAGSDTMEVHATKDIAIPNLHWTGAMAKIDGVFLKFNVVLNGIQATATANKIVACTFPKSTFELDQKYKASTKEEVNSIFKLFN